MATIDELIKKADAYDPVSMRELGRAYIIGKDIPKDEAKGFQLIRGAVWEGDPIAAYYCGICCANGIGLPQKAPVSAARYYEYGARAGVIAAQYELARIYMDAELGNSCFAGGANPYIGCERWLKKAANQGYIPAEELLASILYEGVYLVKDVDGAVHWYEKAANQGSVDAMYRVAIIYYNEPIDYNKAGQWFSMAASKGNKDAAQVLQERMRYNRFTQKWDIIR